MSYTDDVRDACNFDTSRPLIIAGNGPSLLEVDSRLLPEDAYVFRCNWFFMEDHYRLGRKVDGYFWSIHNEGMLRGLDEAVRIGGYEIGAYFTPVTFKEFADPTSMCSKLSFTPCHNPWRIIAGQPDLAAAMMMRPLPTQGMQMLATALQLGFRDIHLVGIDFYQGDKSRYAYPVSRDIAEKWLQLKDVTPGYEDGHSMDVDLRMLQYCLDSYPGLRIRNHGMDNPLIPRSREVPSGDGAGRFEVKPVVDPALATASKRPLYKKFVPEGATSELKCAYVTYANDDFAFGVAALANSLGKLSDVPLVVMVAPDVDLSLFPKLENVRIYVVNKVDNPNTLSKSQLRFQDTYSKLNVFGLSFLDRAVFLDADTLVLKNIDHLFSHEQFAAAPDFGLEHNRDTFNSGVFVCSPSPELYSRMMEALPALSSYDGGDQGFLNVFFNDAERLDWRYNALKRVSLKFPATFQLNDVSVIHYVGQKPWNPVRSSDEYQYKSISSLWFSALPEDSKIALFHRLRAESEMPSGPSLKVDTTHFEVNGEVPEAIKDMEPIELRPLEMANVMVSIGRTDLARAISEVCLQKNPSSRAHRVILAKCDSGRVANAGPESAEPADGEPAETTETKPAIGGRTKTPFRFFRSGGKGAK
ncbi:MAG: hypothetical protein EOP88_03055 [Verrucomicrobiaceae bacterium]|nr:MAG: hypothetical protein EOP88_03055 [Verrucomicrobiaceae bacterium]